MPDREVDVAICGAGPAGAAAALFLRERGIAADRIALIDARTGEAAAADDRMIAISHGSATLLARLGAWHEGRTPRATAIHAVHISHRGRFGQTMIDRRDYGVAALGYVVRHGDLTQALDVALEKRGIVVRRPAKVTRIDVDGERLRVAMGEESLAARHVVHAEGGLYDGQQLRAIHRDYGQTAVTAFVTVFDRHADPNADALARTAFERFTEDGPIALLPAVDASTDGRVRDGYSLVWCGKPDEGAARLALDDRAFLDALHGAFGDRLGRFASVGPRRAFPLGLNAVSDSARLRSPSSAEFAIGNAAQTLHPVAGQGLNLGLRDAHDLSALLASDASASALVARFATMRRVDRATTVNLTDFMPRVFASRMAPVAWGRGLTLALLDVSRPLRGLFARQMMNGRR